MNEEKDTSAGEETNVNIATELKSIGTMRQIGLITFIIGIVLIIGIMVAALALNIKISPIVVLPIALGVSAVGAVCTNKKCPQCGKPFYGMPIRFFWAHSCMHCKISYKNDNQGDN